MHALLMTLLAISANPADPKDVFEEHSITYTGGDYKNEVFKYRLLKPEKIEPGKKYPVVLFLHGAGERGNDNHSQLKYFPDVMAEPANRTKYPCFIVAPQCRNDKKWADVDWSQKASTAMPEKTSDQMQVALMALDETIKDNPIDTSRQYLTGLSMGGYGSWDLAERFPDRFAAVAPVCGGGDETKADRLVHVPIFVYHGDADNAVPVDRSRHMIEAIKKAGGDPKYTELKGVGHNSWERAYHDEDGIIPWMFQQVKKDAKPKA